MSIIVGQVSKVEGVVKAVNPVTGEERVLQEGSEVFAGEIIQTSGKGGVVIEMNNGTLLTLGRDTQMRLDEDVTSQASFTDSGTEGSVDIEALQQAVLEGNFEALEAAAAGEALLVGSASEGGVFVERLAAEGEVTSGFETTAAAPAFDIQDEDAIIDGENEGPEADPVLTRVNQGTDYESLAGFASSASTPDADQIAFFKLIDIGGGLDGDLSIREDDGSDPADLGGEDLETAENSLVFDITSLPSYGDLYIEQNGVYTKVDTSNLNDATTLLSTADKLYWVATHGEALDTPEQSIGGVYDSVAGMQESWTSNASVKVSAVSGNYEQADISYNLRDGIGVVGDTGGPNKQLGYDAKTGGAERIVVDFTKEDGEVGAPVTNVKVAITHLIKYEGGGEIGHFEAFLDGKSLGKFSFSNNPYVGADYLLDAEAHGSGNSAGGNSGTLVIDDLVFDQIVFSAGAYGNQGDTVGDSSDYFIGGITYHEVPDVEFGYKVIDESGAESSGAPVVIDVFTDTDVPELVKGTPDDDGLLVGANDADLIIGGLGSDTMTGGAASDTFAWLAGEADGSTDTITDFTLGRGGDLLDLSEILINEENGDLSNYLNINYDGVDSTLVVNADAAGADELTIVLKDINLNSLGATQLDIINKLIDDGNLIVDE